MSVSFNFVGVGELGLRPFIWQGFDSCSCAVWSVRGLGTQQPRTLISILSLPITTKSTALTDGRLRGRGVLEGVWRRVLRLWQRL